MPIHEMKSKISKLKFHFISLGLLLQYLVEGAYPPTKLFSLKLDIFLVLYGLTTEIIK